MAPQSEQTPVLSVIINILDNKLAGIAYSQDLPLKSFAKKHVDARTLHKVRDVITLIFQRCCNESSEYYSQRLEYKVAQYDKRLKWYSGDVAISKRDAAAAFVDNDIVELLSIIGNCFSAVMNRCDPNFIHLGFTVTDDKIWASLLEISEMFSSMLNEAQQITAPKQVPSETSAPKEASTSTPENNISDVKASTEESLYENVFLYKEGGFVSVQIKKEYLNQLQSQKN